MKKGTTVQRVTFGQLIGAAPCECGEQGYILGLGKRPKAQLHVVGDPRSEKIDRVYKQLFEKEPLLKRHAIPLEEGPYADKDGAMEDLVKDLCEGVSTKIQLIDRMIDVLRPFVATIYEERSPRVHGSENHMFSYNDEFSKIPDVLPTAGEIMTQEDRRIENETFGRELIVLSHVIEPYLLAVSALRRKNLNAYPALAVIPQEPRELYSPLIVLVDLTKEVPMQTFALSREHPSMAAVDILSDTAMLGVTHIVRAEMMVKHLGVEMVMQSKEGRQLSQEEIENQLTRICDALFESHKAWPYNHFVGDVLSVMYKNIGEAMVAVQLGEIDRDTEQIVKEHPELMIPGAIEHHVQVNAAEVAQTYTDAVRDYLNLKVETYNATQSSDGARDK